MSSITNWNRLEPIPRTTDLTAGLRAELADPLWLLARQRQFGELSGEDGGSPVESVVSVEAAPVSRLHLGSLGSDAARRAIDVADPSGPLEPLVERRPVRDGVGDLRVRAEAGMHFARLLRLHGAAGQHADFLAAYPLPTDAVPVELDLATGAWLASVRGRAIDGRTLADALAAHRGSAETLTSLPSAPSVPASARAAVVAAANAYLAWWGSFALELPAGADAWEHRRLEYSFALQATLSDGDVVLRADDYRGGRLDWYEFEADTRRSLGSAGPAAATSRTLVRRTLPSRAFYAGMPAERFWEFEDSSIRFGASVGRTDLAHLLLDEFALAYGNDWYVVPLTVPTGSVCAVREFRVLDSFGIETAVPRSAASATGSWSMFDLSRRAGAGQRAAGLFFLASAVGLSQEGDPLEEVAWFRDEMANLVWAVERRTESPAGGHVDRYEVAQQHAVAAGGSQRIEGEVGDATLIYRLNSRVPENWFPLVPVRPAGAPAGTFELELRPITRVDADGTARVVQPSGRFLTAADPLVVEEEEIGRDGLSTQLHWQLTRRRDGSYALWLAQRTKVGRGEGSSGLIFDIARPVG